MKPIAALIGTITRFSLAALLLALAGCGDGAAPQGNGYAVGYGVSGPVYSLGLGFPAYRLEPRSYWNYPDYRGTGPAIELARRPGD